MKKSEFGYVKKRKRRVAFITPGKIIATLLTLIVIVFTFIIIILSTRFFKDIVKESKYSSISVSQDDSNLPSKESSVSSMVSAEDSISLSSSPNSTAIPAVIKVTEEQRSQLFAAFQGELKSFLGEFPGRIGVSYTNLKTGETFGYNDRDPFVAASSIKMSIMTQLYKQVKEGKVSLTESIAYNSKPYPAGDYEAGTGVIAGQPNGTKFTVRRTAQLAVIVSDNCGTNMIIRRLGGIDKIVSELNKISSNVPYRTSISYKNYQGTVLSGRHRSSASDLAAYARNLYVSWQSDKTSFDPLMEDLMSTTFEFGLQAKLPANIKVAHKIGTNNAYRAENDVGIIFASEPYVICVTTETESQVVGRDMVAEVSLMFYDYITSLYID